MGKEAIIVDKKYRNYRLKRIMKEYILKQGFLLKGIFIALALFFCILSFIFNSWMFCFFSVIASFGFLFLLLQKGFLVSVGKSSLLIRRLPFLLLKEKHLEISFSDIQRLTQFSTPYHRFHLIRLKNGKTVSLPCDVNHDFDDCMKKLNEKLSKEKGYDDYNKICDQKSEKAQILLILFAVLILPLTLIAAITVKSQLAIWIILGIPCVFIMILLFLIYKN